MAWKKIILSGDVATELTGTAYRMLLVDSAGDVIELAHGTANKVLTSGGASADPTWEDAAGGAHGLDAGQSDVTITSPADNELLAYNGVDAWINQTATEAGLVASPHDLGGSDHGSDTLANLNAKVSDATLDDSSDTRDPTAHTLGGSGHSSDTLANLNAKVSDATLDDSSDTRAPSSNSVGNTEMDNTANDIAVSQLIFTPKSDGSGTTEGAVYFDTEDKHLYAYVS